MLVSTVIFTFLLLIIGSIAEPPSSQKYRDILWSGGNSIEWPSQTTKIQYKHEGRFIGKNVIASRAVVNKDDAFVALPRYKPGVPFTLGRISLKSKNSHANLSPFPCWSLHEEGNCAALQNVVDLFLDPQGILWALDTGVISSFEAANRTCPPKFMAINARSGKVVKTVDLSSLTNNESRLQYVIADYTQDGRVFIYIPDAANRALLIFDVTSNRGYRLILPECVAVGSTKRDVLFAALIRRPNDVSNFLLFSYINSNRVYAIATEYLQSGYAQGMIRDLGEKKGKMVFLGTDNGSAVFFRREGESDVYKWDLLECPNSHTGVQRVYEGSNCALPTQVTVDFKRGRMRVLESNFPDFFQGTVGCGVNHALRVF